MPIVNTPPEIPVTPTGVNNDPVQIADTDYKHSLVDTTKQPLTAMITHIEGMTWVGDGYFQMVSRDEELSPFQPGQTPPYQQYHLVKNMQAKLQGGLSPSAEDGTSVMSLTGTVRFFPGVKPNQGDVWLADVGDGRLGQFTVSSMPRPLTLYKDTVYEADVALTRFMDENLVDVINQRVVKTSYFISDFLVYGQNPIVGSDVVAARELMTTKLKELTTSWFQHFYSTEHRTALVPGQAFSTYDPYVIRAILDILRTSDHQQVSRLRNLNCDGMEEAKQKSIWDVLINVDDSLMPLVFAEPRIVSSTEFHFFPYFESIRYSSIANVVVAKSCLASVDLDYSTPIQMVGIPWRSLNDMKVELASAIFFNSLEEFHYPEAPDSAPTSLFVDTEVAMVHPIAGNGGYVFSSAFYTNDSTNYSKLELLVKQFLRDKGVVNRDVLMALANASKEWGRLEKYYLWPVLMILLIVSLRRL